MKMDTNIIYNEECLQGLKRLPDNSVDAIIIDPPYYIQQLQKKITPSSNSVRQSSKNAIFHHEFDHFESIDHYKEFMFDVLRECNRIIKPKGQFYMFFSFHHIYWMIEFLHREFRFYKQLIWYKPDVMGLFPNQYGSNYEPILWFRTLKNDAEYTYKNNIGNSQRDVFTFYSTNINDRKDAGFHPTPKPKALIRQLIKNCSNEGDIVLDCFMGSGTTAVACKETNRQFIGFERDPEFYAICMKRLQQTTLQKDWFSE